MMPAVLLLAAVAVIAASSIGAAVTGEKYLRLHFLAPVTSLGGPLIGLAVAIDDGWSPSGVLALLITLLLAATGPVVQAATARAIALRDKPRSAKVAP